MKLLIICIVVTIALSKRINNEMVTRECTKLMQIILPLLEICEHEVDELVGMEIDILAVRPEDRPPLPFHPRKNRRIDDLSLEFATEWCSYSPNELRKLLVHLHFRKRSLLPNVDIALPVKRSSLFVLLKYMQVCHGIN